MQSYSNLDDSKWHVDGFRNNSIRNLFDVCLGKWYIGFELMCFEHTTILIWNKSLNFGRCIVSQQQQQKPR